jgi:Tfp pilus assembly protein PilF
MYACSLLGTVELNLEQAIKQDARQPFYNLYLAQIHLDQKKLTEAESDCLYELEISPDSSVAHHQLGLVCMSGGGDLRKAQASFEKAIALDPSWRAPQRKLTQLLKKMKQQQEQQK